MTANERLGFVLGQLDRIQGMHARLDGRCNTLFGLNVAMATITILNLTGPVLNNRPVLIAIGSLVAMAVAFGFIIAVSYSHLANRVRPSLLYFGDIARLASDDYIRKVNAATEVELADDALCQIWRNSEILKMKFGRTQRAFYATCIAMPLWLAFLSALTLETGALPIFSH